MRGVNKVIIVGTLGADPDVKYAANGNAIANLSVATSEEWNDKNTGQKQQKTEWHKVAMFGKLAEIAGQFLRKGSQVYLEGKLQTRKWRDQNGQDRYTTEVVISGFEGAMQMLGSPRDQQSQGAQSGQMQGQPMKPMQPPQQNNQAAGQQQAPQQGYGNGYRVGQGGQPAQPAGQASFNPQYEDDNVQF